MNLHLNWVAAEGADVGVLQQALGLWEVGASNDGHGADYACLRTPQGWSVVVGQGMKLKLDKLMPRLSAEREMLAGEASDIVMSSGLQAWRAGVRLWSVAHGPEEGVEGLEVAGTPPGGLAEIEKRLVAKQAEPGQEGVDHVFDAPLELSERICGFHPDQPQAGPWILLAPASDRKAPAASALPAAIRAELLPAMADLGWTVAPIFLPANGRAYDASRIRNGRLETARFLWRDDRRKLVVIPSFAMLEGDQPDDRVVVSAGIFTDPKPLGERIASWRPGKTYEDRVRDAVAVASADVRIFDQAIDDTVAAQAGSE